MYQEKEWGRGLASIEDSVDVSIWGLEDYIKKNKWSTTGLYRSCNISKYKATLLVRGYEILFWATSFTVVGEKRDRMWKCVNGLDRQRL